MAPGRVLMSGDCLKKKDQGSVWKRRQQGKFDWLRCTSLVHNLPRASCKNIQPWHAMPYYVVKSHVMENYAIQHHAIKCHNILYHAVLKRNSILSSSVPNFSSSNIWHDWSAHIQSFSDWKFTISLLFPAFSPLKGTNDDCEFIGCAVNSELTSIPKRPLYVSWYKLGTWRLIFNIFQNTIAYFWLGWSIVCTFYIVMHFATNDQVWI